MSHETQADEEDEEPYSEEEGSCTEESDLTTLFEREIDALASTVEATEESLDVQDVKDLRELSESMQEGPASIGESHAKLRETTRNRGYQPSSSATFSHIFWFSRVVERFG